MNFVHIATKWTCVSSDDVEFEVIQYIDKNQLLFLFVKVSNSRLNVLVFYENIRCSKRRNGVE